MDVVLARQLRERSAAAVRIPRDRELAVLQPLIEPFQVLFEEGLPRYPLPEVLERTYGSLGFDEPVVYSNFVMSIDGVVTLGSKPSAGSAISGRNPPDRFLMGLLRACADAVLLGAETLRSTPGHHWTPEHVYPDLAGSFARLRIELGRKPRPRLVVVTATGDVPVSHPAVVDGATIITTARGARALADRLPASSDVIELGDAEEVDLGEALEALRARGYGVILTEGGPHVMGELVKRELLDEAFLTLSPVLAGRDSETRLGMIAGVELLPERGVWTRLLSARRHEGFLFLRYGLRNSQQVSLPSSSGGEAATAGADVTATRAPDLMLPGMLTAQWSDGMATM